MCSMKYSVQAFKRKHKPGFIRHEHGIEIRFLIHIRINPFKIKSENFGKLEITAMSGLTLMFLLLPVYSKPVLIWPNYS